jgi:hypothetical protein
MALGAVKEIPEFPVTGSITSAKDAAGIVVDEVVTIVEVVCAPTLPLKPSSVARQATLVTEASLLALLRGRAPTKEVGVEVETSDTAGHLCAFGEEVERKILPTPTATTGTSDNKGPPEVLPKSSRSPSVGLPEVFPHATLQVELTGGSKLVSRLTFKRFGLRYRPSRNP